MKILIVTDAWVPQVNGVVRTMQTVIDILQRQGADIRVISPDLFRNIPMLGYKEISLALLPRRTMERMIEEFGPDMVHISTEGPLGWAARAICSARNWRFTTCYHTKFPEYAAKKFGVPTGVGYAVLRRFHALSAGMMVSTESLRAELAGHGLTNTVLWTRGVDTQLFHPANPKAINLPSPVMVYVGRVSAEKNIESFLSLDVPGTKLIVGDGPQLPSLRQKYPDAVFVGFKHGAELAAYYASGDVFVFPSKSDTFGLVMLEALASGLPIAAYPVTGPRDVLQGCEAGVMHDCLATAIEKALEASAMQARAHAEKFSWAACADMFQKNLVAVA